MRDAPSLAIIPVLQAAGASIIACDPEGKKEAAELLENVEFTDDPYDCIKGADALVIITEWDQYRALNLKRVKESLKSPVIVDLRNIYKPEEMAELGFHYVSIGRAPVEL